MAPAPSLPPTLPSGPRTAGESDPFQNLAGPEPTADFASRGAPGLVRAEATMTVPGAAEGPEIRVEQSTAPLPAARLAGERLVPQERIERPPIEARVDPGNPLAAKLAEPWTDQESARVQAGAAPLGAPARLAPGRTGGEEKHAIAPEQRGLAPEPRGLDSEPGTWAPGQSFENHLIPAGGVERLIERSGERPLEPPAMAARFASAPPRTDAPRPSSPAAKLAPPVQREERAEAPAPDEPRLVIGRLQVDVVPAPVPAPATIQVIAQGTPARQRSGGRASNLRFGLGQI